MNLGELDSWGDEDEDSDLDSEEEEKQRDLMMRHQLACAELMARDSADTSEQVAKAIRKNNQQGKRE